MEKWLQAKKQHHYVWEYYLKKWAIDEKVFWITPKRKIAHDSPKGMCRTQALYKINTLEPQDIEFIKAHFRPLSNDLRQVHIKKLEYFIKVSKILDTYARLEENGHDFKIEKESLLFNPLENDYCGIESGAKPAMDSLTSDDPHTLETPKNLICLYSYIGHQITRTLGFKQKFFSLFEENKTSPSAQQFHRKLTEKNWWFLSYMFGYNIGCSLYRDRLNEPLIILKNTTAIPFITSDNPVINIYPGNTNDLMDIYFPLSPQHALLICASEKWKFLEPNLTGSNVHILNTIVAQKAHFSIYSSSKESIEHYKKSMGSDSIDL